MVALSGGGDLPVDWVGRGRFHPKTMWELFRRTRSSDVVVAHGSSTLVAMFAISLITRRPYVYRSIGDPDHWVARRLGGFRVGTYLRRAAAIVALWPAAGSRLVARYHLEPAQVVTIVNGVTVAEFPVATADERSRARAALELDDDARVVCFVGALSPEKNPAAAVRAAAAGPRDLVLLIAGDGHLRDETTALAQQLIPGALGFSEQSETCARCWPRRTFSSSRA